MYRSLLISFSCSFSLSLYRSFALSCSFILTYSFSSSDNIIAAGDHSSFFLYVSVWPLAVAMYWIHSLFISSYVRQYSDKCEQINTDCLATIVSDPQATIWRVKNRLAFDYDVNQSAGYRDVLLDVTIVSGYAQQLGIHR